MVQRTAVALVCVLALAAACAPVGPTSLAVDTSALTAATLGAAQAQVAQTAPQPTPGTDFQFPPPAPNQQPGPNIVAPSPTDDRTPPPPIQMAPSAGAPLANSELMIFNLADGSAAGRVSVGRGAALVDFSRDGRRVYVTNPEVGSLAIVDAAARSVIATVPTAAGAEGLAVSPDGRWVYVANRDA